MIRDDELAAKIGQLVFGRPFVPPYSGFVKLENGWPRAVAVFNHYTGSDVHLTVCANRPFRLSDVRQIAHLAFVGLDVERVTAIVSEFNTASLNALTRIGFQREGVMRRHFGTEDGIVLGLLRDEQKLIRVN